MTGRAEECPEAIGDERGNHVNAASHRAPASDTTRSRRARAGELRKRWSRRRRRMQRQTEVLRSVTAPRSRAAWTRPPWRYRHTPQQRDEAIAGAATAGPKARAGGRRGGHTEEALGAAPPARVRLGASPLGAAAVAACCAGGPSTGRHRLAGGHLRQTSSGTSVTVARRGNAKGLAREADREASVRPSSVSSRSPMGDRFVTATSRYSAVTEAQRHRAEGRRDQARRRRRGYVE